VRGSGRSVAERAQWGKPKADKAASLAVLSAAVDAWVLVWWPRPGQSGELARRARCLSRVAPSGDRQSSAARRRTCRRKGALAGGALVPGRRAKLQTKRLFVPAPVHGQFGRQLPAALAEQMAAARACPPPERATLTVARSRAIAATSTPRADASAPINQCRSAAFLRPGEASGRAVPSVAVMLRFEGPLLRHADIGRLLGPELGELGADFVEVEPGNLLVEVFG
jgi:hypothetical protein